LSEKQSVKRNGGLQNEKRILRSVLFDGKADFGRLKSRRFAANRKGRGCKMQVVFSDVDEYRSV